MKHRLFISIPVPDELIQQIQEFQKQFPLKNVPWTNLKNLHITTLFIGDVKSEYLESIKDQIQEVISNHKKFQLEADGLKIIPRGKVSMIWLKIKESKDFTDLSESIKSKLSTYIKFEDRIQLPHITLARYKGKLWNKLKNIWFPKATISVQECQLIESHLKPTGAEYKVLDSFELRS